jgi:CheY-like chemotaxis protein
MDDDPTVRDVLGLMLKHLGYTCEFSSDGSELLEMYQKAMDVGRPFDVVIMDLTVPGGMGGVETIPKLLEIDPDAKAIVSSGYSSNKAIANYKEYGFKNIAIKPYRIQELGEILKRTILM